MKNENVVSCIVNSEERKITVKKTIPYLERAIIAKSVAKCVVNEEGEYKPWACDPVLTLLVLSKYTDFEVPEAWGDNELSEFVSMNSSQYQELISIFEKEYCEIANWIDKLVEYRKQCYKKSSFDKFLSAFKDIVEQLPLMNREEIKTFDDFLLNA